MDEDTKKHIEGRINSAYGSSVWIGDDPSGPVIEMLIAQTTTLMEIEKRLVGIEKALVHLTNTIVHIANSRPFKGRIN